MRQFKNTQTITDRNTTAMGNYLHDVNHYPMITMDEEVALAQLIHKGGLEGERAKKRLVEANLRFVVSVANQYHQKNMELADLVSEGNIGLIKAAERFDDTKGFKFISYAVWWIRQSIIEAIAEQGRLVRMPNNQQALLQLYNHLAHETLQTEHRMPTADEFAEFAAISVEKARMLMGTSSTTVSTDAPIGEDNDNSIGDMLVGGDATDKKLDRESLQHDLMLILNNSLKPRECEIVTRCFGLGRQEESIDDIGADLGLSRERVRQIRERAIMKLRDNPQMLNRYLG